MGHDIRITITDAPALTEDRILIPMNAYLMGRVNDLQFDRRPDGVWWVSATSKYEPEGVESFAEALSAMFTAARVDVTVEWDTKDADEAGAVEYAYIAGTRCHDRVTGLVPTDLEASIARVRVALSGMGDLPEAARWLVDGLEGTRRDEEPAAVPPTVATVTVRDRWGNDYSERFADLFDYSDVTEQDGVGLLTTPGWGDRRLSSREDVSGIIQAWIEHAEQNSNTAYGVEWLESADAYVMPYWDGESTGFLTIHDDGDGDGRIPFENIVTTLGLSVEVTWSDGTTTTGGIA